MPLPTRRAVRPDSRHHRDARRYGLSHRSRSRGRRFWNLVGGLSLIALIVSVIFATVVHTHHAWVMPMLYASMAGVVLSILAMLFS